MKWLVLLFIVSCGKHLEPKLLDIKDKDGDTIFNYLEEDVKKFIADIDRLGKVKGVIRFHQNQIHEISFSNESSPKDYILSHFTRNERFIKKESYFSEWEKLNLVVPSAPILEKLQYKIQLNFDSSSDQPSELVLRTKEGELKLGRWSSSMNLEFSKEVLMDILSGESSLLVRKNLSPDKMKSIQEKTYKLYFHDKNRSEIFYISKDLSLVDILEKFNISESTPFHEDKIFLNTTLSQDKRWYHRELSNGDKFLIHSSMEELINEIKKHYTFQKLILKRENGKAVNQLSLSNSKGAKVYLKLHAVEQTQRSFKEEIKKLSHGYGGGGGANSAGADKVTCNHYLRSINQEVSLIPQFDFLIASLMPLELISKLNSTEYIEDDDIIWNITSQELPEHLILSFNDLDDKSFLVTGEYKNSCSFLTHSERFPSFKTHPEGKLSVEIESYVEKIL